MKGSVIIACDFDSKELLFNFLEQFNSLEEKPYLKIGMEMFYLEGPQLVRELKELGYRIFLDLKLHDIPNTVNKAMKSIAKLNIDIINVHAAGGIKMMEKALEAFDSNNRPLVIAVTQLTSTSNEVMNKELCIPGDISNVVKEYAINTKKANLDGVVCSALEAPIMKNLGLISVTPGIRLETDSQDDQVRTVTPKQAKELGSTFIVVGRPITKANEPLKVYKQIMEDFLC